MAAGNYLPCRNNAPGYMPDVASLLLGAVTLPFRALDELGSEVCVSAQTYHSHFG